MRLRVDADQCIGAGQCVLIAPAVFDQDEDDGTVVLLHESVSPDQEVAIKEAVNSCPARVISLERE
jgi:ferredoxin